MAEEAKSGGGACASLGAAYGAFAKTRFGAAIDNEKGATFNLFFAHILFWAFGMAGDNPEYSNSIHADDGSVPSGSKGSGVFIIGLIAMIVATVLWLIKVIRIMINGVPETAEDIVRKKTTRRLPTNPDEEMAGMERKASSHDVKEAAKAADAEARRRGSTSK